MIGLLHFYKYMRIRTKILSVITVAIILPGFGCSTKKNDALSSSRAISAATDTSNSAAPTVPAEQVTWKQYTNKTLGITVSYPDYMSVDETTSSVNFTRININDAVESMLLIQKAAKTTLSAYKANWEKIIAEDKEALEKGEAEMAITNMPQISTTTLAGKEAIKTYINWEGERTEILLPKDGIVIVPEYVFCMNECQSPGYVTPPTGPTCRDSCEDLDRMVNSFTLVK